MSSANVNSQSASISIKARNLTLEQKKELQLIIDTYPVDSVLSKNANLLLLYSDGHSAKVLSKQFSYETTQIYNLFYRYKRKGIDGILPKVKNPKASLSSQSASISIKARNLTLEQKKELQLIIDTHPVNSVLSKNAKVFLLYSDGHSAKALSKQFSCETTQIYNLFYRYKEKGVDGILPKVKNPKASLSSQSASISIKARNLTLEQKKELQLIIDTYPVDSVLSKNAKVFLLYSDGRSAKALSKQFSYETTQIYNLFYCYKEKGVDGILPKVKNPKAPLGFTSEQKQQLEYICSILPATSKERIKYQAIQLFLSGLSSKEIEDTLPICQSQVYGYVKKFNNHDWKGLASRSYLTYSKEAIGELKDQMKLCPTPKMRLRCEIVYLYSTGLTAMEVANQLFCSVKLVRQCIKLYEQGGQQELVPIMEQPLVQYSKESVEQLEQILNELPGSSPKRLRYQIVQLHSKGLSLKDIAQYLSCSSYTVSVYVRLFRDHGIESLHQPSSVSKVSKS